MTRREQIKLKAKQLALNDSKLEYLWIDGAEWADQSREIDWNKIWLEYLVNRAWEDPRKVIQELVEKQLKGEE